MTKTFDECEARRRERQRERNAPTVGRPRSHRAWTPEEDGFLIDNPEMGVEEKAERLGRSIHSVKTRMSRLGVSGPRSPEWSPDDLMLLRDLDLSCPEVARMTGRTVRAVESRRQSLRYRGELGRRNRPWTDEDFGVLTDETLTLREMAEALGVSEGTVSHHRGRLRELGIIGFRGHARQEGQGALQGRV